MGNQSTEVIDCYSESNVSGVGWTGGLIGLNAMNSTIIRSYSSGLTFNNQGRKPTRWLVWWERKQCHHLRIFLGH